MKSFLWTIFLLIFLFGVGYLIWWQTPVKDAFVKWGLVPGEAGGDDKDDGTVAGSGGDKSSNGGTSNGGQTDPGSSIPSTTPPSVPTRSDAELAREFPMPNFKPFTYYTQTVWANWTRVPTKYFPESVRLKKTVALKLPSGSATREAGSEVYPVSLSNTKLVVSVSPNGNIRGTVNVNDTTFKEDIKGVYDRNVEKARSRVMKRRDAAKTGTVSKAARLLTKEEIKNLGSKPETTGPGNAVVLMQQSIASGKPKEISGAKIIRWSPVTENKIDEQNCWTATVVYERKSFFGVIESEAMAMMRNGRILKWVYVGTTEELE